MTKRLILSLLMIGITIAAVTSATVAYFTDTATSTGNTLATGTLDISFGENTSLPVTVPNMQPGEEKQIRIDVKNTGTLPVNLAAYALGTWTNTGLDNNMMHVTKMEYFDGTNWISIKENVTGIVYYSPTGDNLNLWVLDPNVTEEFRLTVKLDINAGNTYQTETYNVTINVGAKQTTAGAAWPAGF